MKAAILKTVIPWLIIDAFSDAVLIGGGLGGMLRAISASRQGSFASRALNHRL